MKKRFEFFLVVWTVGLLGGLLFSLRRMTGRVKIIGYDLKKLDPENNGLIVVVNHESLWEPLEIPLTLFFPHYLFRLRFTPFSIVDKINYYSKLWFSPVRSACIDIERGKPKAEIKTIDKIIEMLKQGRIVVLYAEGGRTFKGGDFKYSKSSKKIRRFPKGLRKLFLTGTPILPIWTEGGSKIIPDKLAFPRFPHAPFPRVWRKTRINIGQRFIPDASKNEIVECVENHLLETGDGME